MFNRVQITCESAYHVQYVYHVKLRDSSAIKFDRVESLLFLALLYWLEPFDEGVEET